jgi:hypothetical protein
MSSFLNFVAKFVIGCIALSIICSSVHMPEIKIHHTHHFGSYATLNIDHTIMPKHGINHYLDIYNH